MEGALRVHRTPIVSRDSATRRRVLHVEHDAFVAALVQATLEDAGLEVHWFSTGRSALTAARSAAYDGYLLGAGPRDMSGALLADELARLADHVPVIVIADGAENVPFTRTVVSSPFAPRALAGAVEAALAEYPEAA